MGSRRTPVLLVAGATALTGLTLGVAPPLLHSRLHERIERLAKLEKDPFGDDWRSLVREAERWTRWEASVPWHSEEAIRDARTIQTQEQQLSIDDVTIVHPDAARRGAVLARIVLQGPTDSMWGVLTETTEDRLVLWSPTEAASRIRARSSAVRIGLPALGDRFVDSSGLQAAAWWCLRGERARCRRMLAEYLRSPARRPGLRAVGLACGLAPDELGDADPAHEADPWPDLDISVDDSPWLRLHPSDDAGDDVDFRALRRAAEARSKLAAGDGERAPPRTGEAARAPMAGGAPPSPRATLRHEAAAAWLSLAFAGLTRDLPSETRGALADAEPVADDDDASALVTLLRAAGERAKAQVLADALAAPTQRARLSTAGAARLAVNRAELRLEAGDREGAYALARAADEEVTRAWGPDQRVRSNAAAELAMLRHALALSLGRADPGSALAAAGDRPQRSCSEGNPFRPLAEAVRIASLPSEERRRARSLARYDLIPSGHAFFTPALVYVIGRTASDGDDVEVLLDRLIPRWSLRQRVALRAEAARWRGDAAAVADWDRVQRDVNAMIADACNRGLSRYAL